MTTDQKLTLWTSVLTAIPTIVFTGAVAFWTWWRDQERIIVQKSPKHWRTETPIEESAVPSGLGIVVKNLSLFPVRVIGLGFTLSGKTVFSLSSENHEEDWPSEISPHARMVVYANPQEWNRIVALGLDHKIMDNRFVAVARTETGSLFRSNRLSVRMARTARRLGNLLNPKRLLDCLAGKFT